MRIPGPMRAVYECDSPKLVFMKGAQIGASEYAINLALWVADTGYAGRGTALYVQPTGGSAGDFVQGRVNPAFDQSDYLQSRIGKLESTKSPDKVGLRKVGLGYTYWRTAKSRSGLKSVPADVLILDEYDEMPAGTLALASHRMDSSTAPRTVIISTPTYPGMGIEPEYLDGDQRRFYLTCDCGVSQPLEWEQNVDLDGMFRVCRECRESIEPVIAAAWAGEGGEWRATNPAAPYASFHLSRLYRPDVDLREIHEAITSPVVHTQQEAVNQHLGLPFSPPGGQMSVEELRRLCTGDFTLAERAGVQGCWMGVDVGSRLNVVITWDGRGTRELVGVCEVDSFEEVDRLMRRFDVRLCVMDAKPELHAAVDFQFRHPGRVYLAEYILDRTPPVILNETEADPKRRWRVQVDRTSALDAVFGVLRAQGHVWPKDAESIPGFFGMLRAPVRQIIVSPTTGLSRAVYQEGANPDHYAHSYVYAELAAYVGANVIQSGTFDTRVLSTLGAHEGRL